MAPLSGADLGPPPSCTELITCLRVCLFVGVRYSGVGGGGMCPNVVGHLSV